MQERRHIVTGRVHGRGNRPHRAASAAPRQGHEQSSRGVLASPGGGRSAAAVTGLQKGGGHVAHTACCLRALRPASSRIAAGREPQVFLGFVDTDHPVRRAGRSVDGAAARLSRPSCQDVLRRLCRRIRPGLSTTLVARGKQSSRGLRRPAVLSTTGTAPQCSAGTTLAFTQTGSPVIHVCGRQFRDRFHAESHDRRDHRDSRVPARARTWRESAHQRGDHRTGRTPVRWPRLRPSWGRRQAG